eukprot:6549776-Ditylum_brightwellii.AAC.1
MEKDYSTPNGEKVMNFFQFLCASGSASGAAKLVAANLYGPALQTIKERYANDTNLSSDLLISMTKEAQIKFLISLIKQFYDANVKYAFSLSINASKVVEMIQSLLQR